eukprot:1655608-Pyramimonas_sp.AAC.2
MSAHKQSVLAAATISLTARAHTSASRCTVQVTGQNGFRGSNFDKEYIVEKSRFLKNDVEQKGHEWLYVDGEVKYEDFKDDKDA